MYTHCLGGVWWHGNEPLIKMICLLNSSLFLMLKEIVFEAYAPLGSPGRRDRVKDYPVVINDPVLKQIAENHNATPGQVEYL